MEIHSLACHKACRKNSSLVPVLMEVGSLACYMVVGSKKTTSSVRNASAYPCHCSCLCCVTRYGLFPLVVGAPQLTLMGLVLTSSTLQHEQSSSHMNHKEGQASLASVA
uniref:Uncharacterized protein n=1 Tax=Arundo donax TaxID=35708 RepID=A0A0A9E7I0_ARUDO